MQFLTKEKIQLKDLLMKEYKKKSFVLEEKAEHKTLF